MKALPATVIRWSGVDSGVLRAELEPALTRSAQEPVGVYAVLRAGAARPAADARLSGSIASSWAAPAHQRLFEPFDAILRERGYLSMRAAAEVTGKQPAGVDAEARRLIGELAPGSASASVFPA